MKLAVIIVSFNNCLGILKLVETLLENRQIVKRIIVVDNNSTDGTAKKVTEKFKENKIVTVITNKCNQGFAKANNIGIKAILTDKPDRILFINQDVQIEPRVLSILANSTFDLVSPLIKFGKNGRQYYDWGGIINWKWGRTHHLESVSKNDPVGFKPDYISGCCLLVKREVLEKTGFFDEHYFLYFEDVDFCLRAKSMDFSIGIERNAVIYHSLKDTRQKPFFQRKALIMSNAYFIKKQPRIFKPLAYLHLVYLGIRVLL